MADFCEIDGISPQIQYQPMNDNLPAITEVLEPERKKPGRKPGSGKVPGSGRKAGTRNKVPQDLREVILRRGKPLELLCDISRGVKIRVGPQAGPAAPEYTYPTMQERAAAAKILVDKLVPPAAALPQGDGETAPPIEDLDLARMLTFLLTKGSREANGGPVSSLPARAAPVADRFAEERALRTAEEKQLAEAARAQVEARAAADEADGVHWLGGRRIVPGWREDGLRPPAPKVVTRKPQ